MTVKHIHGGDVFGAAELLNVEYSEILDYSANINPLGPPPGVFDAIKKHMELIVNYPDPRCRELKEALCQYLDVESTHVMLGNGVSELIYLLVRVLGCKRALIPVPTFTEYGLAVITAGGAVKEIPLLSEKAFRLEVDTIASMMSAGDLIFICNPNNPTGNLFPRHEILFLLHEAEAKGAYLVIDEAFIDFVKDMEEYSVISRAGKSSNLIVLYSLTKFFGLPGLRLGAILGPRGLMEKMTAAKDPWNVNLFAQVGGIAALSDARHMQKTRQLVTAEREYLYNGLRDIPGFNPYPGEANFLLTSIKNTGLTAGKLKDLMRQRGILVRDCSSFNGLDNHHIRLAVRTRPENERLLEELAKVLKGANL